MNPPPRVFMSYSHDSEPHMERVLALANRLRHDGVDAMIDRYEQSPPGGWVHWMTDQVEMADFVLMICTETYHRRLIKKEVPGLGLGGIWEGHLIANAFYRAGTLSNRFIPVIFDPADATHIPLAFAAAQRYLMSDWSDYPNLFGRLTGQPDMERPPLGPWAGHIPAGRGIEVPIRRAQWTVRPAILLSGVPSKPALFVGRSGAVAAFKRLLRVLPSEESGPLPPRAAAITGWPGVGKSTFITELPHDPEIQASYPDGILWVALGQAGPDDLQSRIVGTLTDWDSDSPGGVATLPELIRRLRDQFRQRRVLIVADDTWESGLASSFLRLPDEGSTVVFTSRSEDVARHLVPVATDRYRLEELTSEDALELLFKVAPGVLEHREVAAELVAALGGLPLAIVVAGGILGSYSAAVHGVSGLLAELRNGERLLRSSIPADMLQVTLETNNPTVAALIQRSTRFLTDSQRIHFAQLGAFVPKPASFQLADAAFVWELELAEAAAEMEVLAGLGLVQPLSDGGIQMHALLNRFAASILGEL